jgi:hypothetical protein
VTGKKGKATKEEEYDEEEEEEDTKGKKKKKQEKPKKYKKGKWNPAVEVIERSEMLEGSKNEPIDYESVRANNKNLIRAAHTGNVKLL